MNVLICENQEIMQTAIEFRLRKIGFDSKFVKTVNGAIEALENDPFSILVLDGRLNTESEINLIGYLKKVMKKEIPIIMVGDFDDEEILLEACQQGAQDFILRPFKPIELLMRIRKINVPAEV